MQSDDVVMDLSNELHVSDSASSQADDFYAHLPVFRGFSRLMEPSLYHPVPDGWLIGVADVV
jgi:hypothetical protein